LRVRIDAINGVISLRDTETRDRTHAVFLSAIPAGSKFAIAIVRLLGNLRCAVNTGG